MCQKRSARCTLAIKVKQICDPENRTHKLFSLLKWMPIQDRIKYRQSILVYKCLNNLAPEYLCGMFEYVKNQNIRTSKMSCSRNELAIPMGKHKVIYENNFRYAAVNSWNMLETELRLKPSLASFKSAFLKHYHECNVISQV